jgi:Fe-S-cluster-containing dehydrogenase component
MKALVIDINRCNGCYNCQIAGKDEHVGNDWTPTAKPQPGISPGKSNRLLPAKTSTWETWSCIRKCRINGLF